MTIKKRYTAIEYRDFNNELKEVYIDEFKCRHMQIPLNEWIISDIRTSYSTRLIHTAKVDGWTTRLSIPIKGILGPKLRVIFIILPICLILVINSLPLSADIFMFTQYL